MKIGIGLPATIPWARSADILEWARRADEGPFSSLGIIDRLVYGNYEPLITLAAAAGATKRIRLITTVLLEPLRNPAYLAKQAASLDALSGGRLTLGMGIGSREDDFKAVELGFKGRGKRLERDLELMKRIWNGEPVGEGVGPIGPAPVSKGGPEILIGGYTPVSIQRAGRLADGFVTGGVGLPSVVGQMYQGFQAAWQAAGRTGKPRLVSAIYTAVGEDPAGIGGEYIRSYYGPMTERIISGLRTTPQAVVDSIHGFKDIGADELLLWTAVADLSQYERLAEIVEAIK
jgi:alkanesulfonate monooxygenase SsuD/methylene tetrahydromethanopterin reductase-like flavin-dependent oxidoreductase (luciferase family)